MQYETIKLIMQYESIKYVKQYEGNQSYYAI